MEGVTIREEPALRLAAMAHQGPYPGLAPVFGRLTAWGAERGLIGPGTRLIGLFLDDPARVPEGRLRSNACMTVPETVQTGNGVRVIHLPPARLAVTLSEGPHAGLPEAYRRIREWLAANGEKADRWEPCREEYLNDRARLPASAWLTAVMVPLVPHTGAAPGNG